MQQSIHATVTKVGTVSDQTLLAMNAASVVLAPSAQWRNFLFRRFTYADATNQTGLAAMLYGH